MRHQVNKRKERTLTPTVLPKDIWRGDTFVEANGTEFEVVWNGHKHGPTLCGDAFEQNRTDQPHRLRLAGERA